MPLSEEFVGPQIATGPTAERRVYGVVIVANRGPNDFVWEDGAWRTRRATGGLVSMLEPLARRPDVAWFCCVSEPPDAEHDRHGLFTTAADQADPGLHVVPVPLPAEMYHAYYGQISNEVLWMLQHGLIAPGSSVSATAERQHAWQSGYLAANARLAQTIVGHVAAARAILIQDYHLYPLPALLRATLPDAPILHFTHIPFPEPAQFSLLPTPWRVAILEGMLGADIVGLQTPEDALAFLDCCSELAGVVVDHDESSVTTRDGHVARVKPYPASVDSQALGELMASPAMTAARDRVRSHVAEHTIIRVDRLDPSKNQLNGFLAFERLLVRRPDLHGRVRFLAFLVPSRTDLRVYRAYREALFVEVERINARFAKFGPPAAIEIFYTNDREQALAAMEVCDVLLVNSLKDGMNLVAKEWAVVSSRPGVLVASETTGVAAEAADSALLISPLDIEGTADALETALTMPAAARSARLSTFQARVMGWTAADWLSEQLADLGAEPVRRPGYAGRFRALITDFDGTLACDGAVSAPTLVALERLKAAGFRLILATGRQLDELIAIFPAVGLFDQVVAENGALLYQPTTRTSQVLGAAPSARILGMLGERGVTPLSVGRVIIASWQEHEAAIRQAVAASGLPLQVICNKDSVMILPDGVSKASGVDAALNALGVSHEQVVGIGDAENDIDFLAECGLAVAVGNALPEVKECVQMITRATHGAGVAELAEWLLAMSD
jgi:trehalose 6-phosphate synthase